MNASANTLTVPTTTTEIISYTLATDGACSGNPGPGGWGVAIIAHSSEYSWVHHEAAGGEDDTTNNRMELIAALKGLRALLKLSDFDDNCPVNVRSDSQYLVNGITKWLPSWKRNGWKKADKKPVSNRDLWEALDDIASGLNVTWTWVRGHSGDPLNHRADELANMGLTGAWETFEPSIACAVRNLLSDRGVSRRNNKEEWISQLLEASRALSEALKYALHND